MNRDVDWRGLNYEIDLLDIQQLNTGLREGRFDVAKASFHAALSLSEHLVVLPSGSALGYGVGPLLLSCHQNQRPTHVEQVTLCPGQDTTASLLFRLFYPDTTQVKQVLFSDIMPQLAHGEADFGVCIHEGRFTWQKAGLHLVEDLGTRWEAETGCPLPLGGILASRQLGDSVIARVQATISDSLRMARTSPQITLKTMRKYAQEMDDQVLMNHVDLYVNDWTEDLGEVGQRALVELNCRARAVGISPTDSPDLSVWCSTQSL